MISYGCNGDGEAACFAFSSPFSSAAVCSGVMPPPLTIQVMHHSWLSFKMNMQHSMMCSSPPPALQTSTRGNATLRFKTLCCYLQGMSNIQSISWHHPQATCYIFTNCVSIFIHLAVLLSLLLWNKRCGVMGLPARHRTFHHVFHFLFMCFLVNKSLCCCESTFVRLYRRELQNSGWWCRFKEQ